VSAETLRHWGQQLISFLLQVSDVQFAREIAALLGVGVELGLVRPYGRAQELEADRLGLFTMAKAGYDPHEAARLWRRMDRPGGGMPAILSTHPASTGPHPSNRGAHSRGGSSRASLMRVGPHRLCGRPELADPHR
jgi:Zn-dependent protease with chaperone function